MKYFIYLEIIWVFPTLASPTNTTMLHDFCINDRNGHLELTLINII